MSQTEEAKRYLENARTILSTKAEKEGGFYKDRKYVRMAGNTAYNGILVALDAITPQPQKGRKSVEHYQRNIKDGKLMTLFNAAYDTLHLAMGYDGNLSVKIAQEGLLLSDKIIGYVETRLGKN
ncbi:DUF5618 family protein [Runella sp.]|jgi:hypothetical protein|uniref:DUF5618 family protein n=1 Tax=Runella sp. TaxID=1960881 RepID=UPI00260D7668|nr:DUF5618 family protein [Runella sp.]